MRSAFIAIMFALALVSPAAACGRERWSAKVLADGTMIASAAVPESVDTLRALTRPYGVGGFDAPRVAAERRLYRVNADLLGFQA